MSTSLAPASPAQNVLPPVEEERGFADFHETQRRAGNPSRGSLYEWIAKGIFPRPYRVGPNRVGWRRADLVAWERTRELAPITMKLSADAASARPMPPYQASSESPVAT